jgi:hypothetical protein
LACSLAPVLGATVALLAARRRRRRYTPAAALDEARRLQEQGKETLIQIHRQMQQRSEVPLVLAAQPFSKPKLGWSRLWPW